MKWILGALAFLVVGLLFQLGLLVYAMYVLLGVLLLSRYLAREWTANISATRHCRETTLEIGDQAKVTVTVENHGLLPVPWLLLEDSLPLSAWTQRPSHLQIRGEWLTVAQLAPRGEQALEYKVTFLIRGYYQFGPLLVESGDLFGLHRRYRVLTEPHFVLVHPKVVPLPGYDVASRRPIGEVRITHRLFEDPTRISGVRPYEQGDPMNRVHWRATARMGKLHSKSYEPSCVAGATILLDFHHESYRGDGELHRSELAVTTAASLANAVYEMGQQVGLVTNGRDAADRIREEGWRHDFRTRAAARARVGMHERSDRLQPLAVETRRGTEQLMQILDVLARVELTDGLTFPQLVLEAESRLPRDASVVAILNGVTEPIAIALGGLRRSGFAVTAILIIHGEREYQDWAQPPEWAARLLAEGIEFRQVRDETSLAEVCAGQLTR